MFEVSFIFQIKTKKEGRLIFNSKTRKEFWGL